MPCVRDVKIILFPKELQPNWKYNCISNYLNAFWANAKTELNEFSR